MAYETAPTRGVEVHYGARETNGKFGGKYGTKDGVQQIVYTYDYDDIPAADSNELVLDVPAYAKVVSAYTEVLEDVTLGGDRTGVDVKVVAGDYDSGDESLAALTRGNTVKDEPNTPTSVGASSAEAVVTLTATGGASGDLTAGKFRTIVEYIPEGA